MVLITVSLIWAAISALRWLYRLVSTPVKNHHKLFYIYDFKEVLLAKQDLFFVWSRLTPPALRAALLSGFARKRGFFFLPVSRIASAATERSKISSPKS